MACGTDELTGGPKCICLGNCVAPSGTGDVCIGKIVDFGICKGFEDEPGVCLGDGVTCQSKLISYTEGKPWDVCTASDSAISYCSAQDSRYCWDSTEPNQYRPDAPNACSPAYESCPIVN
jgi:hypothetical protein